MGRRLTGDWAGRRKWQVNRGAPTVSREDYLDYMTFRRPMAPLFTEIFGPLVGLPEEWQAQGATPEELDFSAYAYRVVAKGGPWVNTGFIHPVCEQEVVEEDDEKIIFRDRMGRLMKFPKGYATIALPLEYPVKNMDDWLAYKHHYAFSEERLKDGWERHAREMVEESRVICVGIPGAFSTARELMGDEEVCVAYYEQPELMHDIIATMQDTAEKVLLRVAEVVRIDELGIHEDMAGKSGPLAGPKQIEEFIGPYYRHMWDLAHDRGCRLFTQDSDGDMSPVVAAFADHGLNVMHPVEPVGNNDVVKLREKHGTRMAFEGGIDKHVLRRGEDAIVAELERILPPMVKTGGYVAALDHRIPNGTPLSAYRFYVKKVWEILARECAAAGLPLEVPEKIERL